MSDVNLKLVLKHSAYVERAEAAIGWTGTDNLQRPQNFARRETPQAPKQD